MPPVSNAQSGGGDLIELKNEINQLRGEFQRTIAEKEKKIEALERQVEALQRRTAGASQARNDESALDRAVGKLGEIQEASKRGGIASWPVGGATLRLMDISLDVMTTAGTSTERDESIEVLQGDGHDPKRRGFTLNQVELGFQGAVDPYLTGQAYIVFTEEGAELEEAYFKTSSLPYDLQLKGGYFLTEFGIINQTHPHAWEWIDQPIINSRLLGGDGTRGPGARLSWLTPLPWFSEVLLGMQNADSESMVSFLGTGHEHGHEHEGEDEHAIETTVGAGLWSNATSQVSMISKAGLTSAPIHRSARSTRRCPPRFASSCLWDLWDLLSPTSRGRGGSIGRSRKWGFSRCSGRITGLFRAVSASERWWPGRSFRKPRLLILDEPTKGIDLTAESRLLELLEELNRCEGLTVIFVAHDVNLAARCASHAALFGGGGVIAGPLSSVFTPENLERIYGIPMQIHRRAKGSAWVEIGRKGVEQ